MQLPELLLRYRRGCAAHQVGRRLRLRERYHVADAVRARHEHDDAVEAERDTTVRRRTVSQRLEQEAEFLLRLFRADAEQLEHCRLHFLAMDTHRAAADLRA